MDAITQTRAPASSEYGCAEGYAAGKERAHWEVRNAGPVTHDAGCDACLSGARILDEG